MKKNELDRIGLDDESIGLIDKINSLVNALKSVNTDMVNTNLESAEIMQPTDIQAQYRPAIAETSAALTASSSYQSDVFDASNYSKLTYIVYADQTGDLYVDESMDGTNFDYSEHIPVNASTGAVGLLNVHGKYIRVRYVNGSTDQTEFRLGVYAEVC